MKGFLIRTGIYAAVLIGIIILLNCVFVAGIDSYPISVAQDNSLLKQSGSYFLSNIPKDHVLVLGSSELNTKMITSHPVNLMKNGKGGVVPNIAGRGSCQAIVHASILAATENIENKKVVVTISPQSFVPQGIMPDMYFANFSELQFCKILRSESLPDDVKARFKSRMAENFDRYDKPADKFYPYAMISKSRFVEAVSVPYIFAKEKLLTLKDLFQSYMACVSAPGTQGDERPINWQNEYARMSTLAEKESDSNTFGFLNDYYKVNIGTKLEDFKDKDVELSYENSVEYDDLQLLLDICKGKGIKPLIISMPLHGQWSDYTGFSQPERARYYGKVNALIGQYDVELYDLSDKEYEPYFLCDVMHLGWIGWLDANERISEFYYANSEHG